jgi:glycerol-3-phosphate dehydrogenase
MTKGTVRVATQFDKTSDATLANVTGLSVNVEASRTYRFKARLYTTSNSSGGVKAAIGGTATATAIIYEAITHNGAAVSAQTRATSLGTAVGGVTAVTAALIEIEGTIAVNAAGTLTVQFAQNASNGTASSVLVGSYFEVWEIG